MIRSRRFRLAGCLILAIALVPFSPVRGQEDRGVDDRPIPQDPARLKRQRAARLAHYRRILVEPYDKVGKKDPRWDKKALEALEQAARFDARSDEDWITPEAILDLYQEAVDAGCDDPLLLYFQARLAAQFPGRDLDAVLRAHYEAADALTGSQYPPLHIGRATSIAAAYLASSEPLNPSRAKRANDWLQTSIDQLVRSAETDHRTPQMERAWLRWANQIAAAYRGLGDSHEEADRKVVEALAKSPVLEGTRHSYRGEAAILAAWRARGSGLASSVTKEGWKIFGEKLMEARHELEAAAVAQPEDPVPPTRLITVSMGLDGDREVMEKWFNRAMEADGDNRDACQAKLTWLEPKWHGNPEDLIAFGRACAATKNWRAGITLLLADAHYRLLQTLDGEEYDRHAGSQQTYEDILSAYDDYIEHFPDDLIERTNFAAFLAACHRPIVASQIFRNTDEIGTGTKFFSKEFIDRLRAWSIEVTEEIEAKR